MPPRKSNVSAISATGDESATPSAAVKGKDKDKEKEKEKDELSIDVRLNPLPSILILCANSDSPLILGSRNASHDGPASSKRRAPCQYTNTKRCPYGVEQISHRVHKLLSFRVCATVFIGCKPLIEQNNCYLT